jgi:putative transposase
MQAHLTDESQDLSVKNRRNGKTSKSVRSSFGQIEIETPRDRAGTYEPMLLPKHDRKLGNGVEQKILSLFGLGMSYRQIQHLML